MNALVENNLLKNSQIRTRYIPTRCQIYLGENPNKNWSNSDLKLCEQSDNLQLIRPQIAEADVIILASMWRKWVAVQLPKTLKNLNLSKDKTLLVIGRRSFLTAKTDEIQGLSNQELRGVRKEVDVHQLEINNIMSRTLDKNVFINVHEIVCGAS